MSWRNVKLIFMREIRDQLRDRRTLFMVAILPMLLYPALGIGMVQMTVLFTEQPRTVVILGAASLPEQPPLLDGNRIAAAWFKIVQDAKKLDVVTDVPGPRDVKQAKHSQDGADAKAALFLDHARQIRELLSEYDRLEAEKEQAEQSSDFRTAERITTRLEDAKAKISGHFEAARMQILIIVPENFGKNIEAANRQIAGAATGARILADYPRPIIVRNSADEKSQIAYRRVKDALTAWESKILEERLAVAGLPQTLPMPVNPATIDLAEQGQISANMWSKLFPALLVIMAVTGAFYPAVDLAAGEKERGTMETLLICPATRSEIVMGKFLTVMAFSVSTVVLNLVSMGFTGKYMASIAGRGALSRIGDLAFPSPLALLWVLVLLIPLAALFSALCLALATFARSSKEGQYYLTPLLMIALGLTMFCLSPAVEITPFFSVMPVVGPSLLLKALLTSPTSTGALLYAIPVLATSIGYSLLALWWAIEQFAREDVLFREAERFEFGLWIRHLLRDKEPTPSFTEGGFCFVTIMLLQFAGMKFMQQTIAEAAESVRSTVMMQILMIQQLVIIASPALFMGIMLTSSVVRTFRLRLPGWRVLLIAALLPLALHPLSLELSAVLQKWFFPSLADELIDQITAMTSVNQPLWFALLAFALAPAICEEIAFRGFILSGFSRSRRVWLAIGMSSLTFGIIHMIPQQVFNATLLGLVLGLLVVRSGSLLPAVVFHFIYNSLQVVRSRIGSDWVAGTAAEWFFFADEQMIRYKWPVLLITAAVAFVLLRKLVNCSNSGEVATGVQAPVEPDRLAGTKVTGHPLAGG